MDKSKLSFELKELLGREIFKGDVMVGKFLERFREGNLTKHKNPKSHFCAYFAAYDPKAKEFFIGHHKKSGLWLFNGGHIDGDEMIKDCLIREIGEEWGLDGSNFKISPPTFFTITEIDNPTKQPCNFHFDLWCFLEIDKNNFKPIESNLLEEFYEYGWKSLEEARKLATGNTLDAIDFVEGNYF
ncbi:MAG: hypothetical protein UR60_C0006G0018 [Candidatus Moranbacteria bacterium GW2011_GWF2_34_56]|nr:MAG: hypothetical protein UR51_C0005G0023 [Candidatus Moranbacteria bacterium GW2011_GWF1_34_10]KKP65196.1 MAG: hypothetical protein UR60_C0006G0018 [Candidatus Moranbacteria bacterium GW2011_GWF2_34_56]HBI17649.1 hypothetical protein [Candidatus Moranbacteria bacterium]